MDKPIIYSKIIAILREVDAVGKNKKNAQQGYMFRGIDDMYNAVHPLFAKHGVFITSEVINREREERQTAKGGVLIYTILTCKFTFYAEDGSSVTSTLDGEAMDSGDKSTNKSMSTALKYALMQMFLIPTEEKLDTEEETHEVQKRDVKKTVMAEAKALLSDRVFFTEDEERAFLHVIEKSDATKAKTLVERIRKQKQEREQDLNSHI